ncbi:MAG: protein translocase subunit SecDF [Bacteroidia bacterium]|nr:protein translocase subunit SecDF [Bacteroidia bacterium]
MKNRNVIIGLLAIFALICAYNIYYTGVLISTDSALSNMTSEKRSKWLDKKDNYEKYKAAHENGMSLGLDLQGGMYITMEIGLEDVVKGLAGTNRDSLFDKAINIALQRKVTSQSSFVDLFVQAIKELDPNVRLATYFASQSNGITFNTPESEVVDKIKRESSDALERAFNILRTRIDQFGVASPNLQKQPGTGRILIELPGVKDADRVRNLLRNTAKLEFWTTYSAEEAFPYIEKINQKIRELEGLAAASDSAKTQDSAKKEIAQKDTTKTSKADSNQVASTDSSKDKDTANSKLSDKEKTEKFFKENPFFALLRFPDFQNMNGKMPVMGYALISDTAKVNQYLNRPEVQMILPSDLKLFWTAKPEAAGSQYLTLIAIRSNRDNAAPLEGDQISDARQDFDQQRNNMPVVSMNMYPEGARKWRKLTGDNIGKSIAIVLDNLVYSYPTVQNVIANGSSQISGNFSIDEAKDLSNLLKAGKLPAPARIEGEEIIGATLGEETVTKGTFSFTIAFVGILAFMILYYRGSGVVANIALLVNVFFVLGISSALNVVLTLPGIAGIILSMAMSVDANVLIYERTREELATGKPMKAAISMGFQNAFSAIMDSNITTFLTGVILYVFGTGPIRGFAVTLMIGIITTLVSALLVTRILLEYLAERKNEIKISFGTTAAADFFTRLNSQFIANRKKSYIISVVAVVISLISFGIFGFKFGVDFQGGRQYIIEFQKQYDTEKVRQDLTDAFGNNAPIVKTVGSKNQLMITTSYLFEAKDADQKVTDALMAGLNKSHADAKPVIMKKTTVGPTIAEDIKMGAIYSVVFSVIVIFAYVAIRFGNWQYGMGALLSLAFNVILVLGLFSLLGSIDSLPFSVEIDQSFIAALLTIVGYSINDTVVVFDRIREVVDDDKSHLPRPTLFNRAINDTLSRTLVTSITTLTTALILFFFGGDVLKGFMFALFFGVTFGTFSSIFMASPISLDLLEWSKKQEPTPSTTPNTKK